MKPQRWWKSPLLWLFAASIGFILLFTDFASEVVERETGWLDSGVRAWAMGQRTPLLVNVFTVITQCGAWYTLVPAALIVVIVAVRRGARKRPLIVAASLFGFSLLVALLKRVYHIDRPDVTAAITFSFPSGHTSGSTAVCMVLGYVLRREKIAPRFGLIVATLVPFLVGLSRIVLDMHWASDVLGGWLIGAAYAAAACSLYEFAYRRAQTKQGVS
jgi:undecaprenyl-diphosphatase